MEVKEVLCKSLLSKSGLWDSKYSINPYRGCSHGCAYCYAPYILREKRKWGNFVEAKVNALEILEKELKKISSGSVLLSSVTDPYQPAERKYMLTRRILDRLKDSKLFVSVLTKSALVTRDIDLFCQMECEVGITLTSLNESVRELFEPGVSPVIARLDALRKLKDAGIGFYVFLGPMLPFLFERDLDGMVEILRELGPERVYVDKLNMKPIQADNFRKFLERNYSKDVVDKWLAAISGYDYYGNMKQRIKNSLGNGLKIEFCY